MSKVRRLSWQLLACLFLSAVLSSTAHLQGPLYPCPTDRFGVGVQPDFGVITDYDVASLHVGWYSDWSFSLNPLIPGGIEYAQLLWVKEGSISPSLEQVGSLVDANPGSLWMIGNEPECIWQGNNTPEQYVDAYHELYTFIKGRDSTAQVAIGGVVQPTPLRLKWLDRMLDHYQATYGEPMPVDVWNIHNMILQELEGGWGCEIPRGLTEDIGRLYTVDDNDNITYFMQHIVEFRTWMRDRGQRDKPLIISEYGVLMPVEYGFTPERVNAFMDASFDYLLSAIDADLGYPADEKRLVQRWLWYSLNEQPYDLGTGKGFNGPLFDHRYPGYPGVITEHGINFREYTDGLLETTMVLQQGVDGYTGSEDTYIYQYEPGTNYCGENQFKVGYKQQNSALLYFDLAPIPTDATIQQASLQVYASGWGGSNMTVEAYRILRNVNLCEATWNEAQTGNAWGLPGCNDTSTDRGALPESTVTTSGTGKWYGLDLTTAVQDWLSGSLTNNGVLLRGASSTSTSVFRFASTQNGDSSLRPRLVITYRSLPSTPGSPSPSDGAVDVSFYTSLDWNNASGTAGYDVYFGTSPTPPYYANTVMSQLDLPRLDPSTQYYWQVVARHGCAETTGPVWSFTTSANHRPVNGTIEPSSGSGPVGVTTHFTTTWSDADGWQDLKQCYFHIGASPSLVGNVTLMYNAKKDKLWILSDDGSTWLGGYAPGTASVLENSQAQVDCEQTTAQGSGDTVEVNWAISFKATFTGEKKTGLKTKDTQGGTAKGQWKGSWTIY